METLATEATEVIEATQPIIDYRPQLEELISIAQLNADASIEIEGFLLFFTVVILCYFAYKFFRIFF